MERTSSRPGVSGMEGSFHELRIGVVQGWIASEATRSGPGGDETGPFLTDMKGAVNQAAT